MLVAVVFIKCIGILSLNSMLWVRKRVFMCVLGAIMCMYVCLSSGEVCEICVVAACSVYI
jgi:hypothetical protein